MLLKEKDNLNLNQDKEKNIQFHQKSQNIKEEETLKI